MFGAKTHQISADKGADDLAAAYKKYACAPFPKSFSNDAMRFYMLERSGIWRGASIVRVNITMEVSGPRQTALYIRIRPVILFYVLLGILGGGFLFCLWQSAVYGAPPLIYCIIPVLGVILLILENNEKQDRCMEKLMRRARENRPGPGDN